MGLKNIILEELGDFDWIQNIPDTELHRYFEVYVCYESFYDEDTGEDECVEGGSYFFKVPTQVVPEIWDYTADDMYYAGPGDEGLEVIEWAVENDIMERGDFGYAEYVTETTKKDYCLAWGNYHDKEVCKEYSNTHWLTDEPVNESNEENGFDWIKEVSPFNLSMDWVIHDDTNKSGREIEQWLFSQGWGWNLDETERYEPIPNVDVDGDYFFNVKNTGFDDEYLPDKTFDAYGVKLNQKMVPNHTIFKWSDLKPILLEKSINESDDFDWIEGVSDKRHTYGVVLLERDYELRH